MLSKSFLKKMRQSLLDEKKLILSQVVQDVDIDTEGDETDEIQGKMLIELTNRLNTRNANKLIQIDSAIKKIDINTYGLCADCNDNIPEKRLLANPHFQTCVACAEDRELELKKGKRI